MPISIANDRIISYSLNIASQYPIIRQSVSAKQNHDWFDDFNNN